MERKLAIPAAALFLFAVLSLPLFSAKGAGDGFEQVVRFDLDTDDGGFLHGGVNDPWEWGVPGEGTTEDPWPGGEMGGAWGSPLNGTYLNGTDAYLELPVMDTSMLSSLYITFMAWYDLSEGASTGDLPDPYDTFSVQVKTSGTEWTTILALTGSSDGSWEEVNLSMDEHIGGPLTVRLRLEDFPDGTQGRGLVIDEVAIYGMSTDPVPVHFSKPPAHPTYLGAFVDTHFSFFLAGGPVDLLGGVSIRIVVSGSDERIVLDRTMDVGASMLGENIIEWTPDTIGQYWVDLVLTGDGAEGSEQYFTCYAVDALLDDDMDKGIGPYTARTVEGESGWTSIPSVEGCLSSSRGNVLKVGEGRSEGFNGTCHATLESGWIDMTSLGTASLSFHHMLDSTGPSSTCGTVVEVLDEDQDWVMVSPSGSDPAYGTLGAGTGPLAGVQGFRGPYPWQQTVLDIDEHAGSRTKVRFSFTSGDAGRGAGLYLDDVLVWGAVVDNDTNPPDPVEGLGYTITSNGRVVLSWDPSEDGDLFLYRVYVGTGTFRGLGSMGPELEVGPEETSATITGLDPEMVHWAAVTAVDASGNEDINVVTVSFTPVISIANTAPVAVIEAVYGTERRLGEDFIFDAGGSYDADNDQLTYLWTLPDGSSDRGVRTRWRSSSEGEDLVVGLMVTDSKGASTNASLTIEVLPEEEELIETGNLLQFLLCLLPLLVVTAMLILVLIVLRNRQKDRLKERLKEAGIEVVGPTEGPIKPEHGAIRDDRRSVPPKVLDLVPIKRPTPAPQVKPVVQRPPPRPPAPPPRPALHPPRAESHHQQHRAEPLKLETPLPPPPRGKEVIKVTLECPFCGGIFKERVDRDQMKKGALEDVVCPECGRKGDIIG